MADRIQLSIVTPDGVAFDGKVNYINLPTPDGSVGILANHAPMVCAVAEGILRIRSDEEGEKSILIGDGIAEIMNNTVMLLMTSLPDTSVLEKTPS